MLFIVSFPSLEIHDIIAWLVLLFHSVIFFTGNSDHHKQNGKSARMGAFFMAGFVTKCDSGAARLLLCPRYGILLSRAEKPTTFPKPWTRLPLLKNFSTTLAPRSSPFDLSSLMAAFVPSSSTPATGKKSRELAHLLRRLPSFAAVISAKQKQAMLHGVRLTLSV